jgi:prolyl oligopeptidase
MSKRFPAREHGSLNDDIAGAETEKDLNAMLYYHRVGTSQDADLLVMKDSENPSFMWGTTVSERDGRYLALTIRRDSSRVSINGVVVDWN